ncbi:hypothetical protein AOQ84DRAFT_278933 [Glonium stellatum]|uniref:tRNA(Phe) 7-[(3-amino-3-carboxypropyl)-4-demethylwyosine(37)-N(4)]-methyltransferase n=1 Tax=Glonium stellatum TaxID=574774 RepID=A0A8E2K0E1_9PEZI|nr:hypothetical protein AOQ84DRAFT_278933 [Glonium stellatum]
MPSQFEIKRTRILRQLELPAEEYSDLSPKGSIDEGIHDLIEEINHYDGLVTTSSCAGRISVFLEGRKKDISGTEKPDGKDASLAGPGGKGGGAWLFISHSPVAIPKSTSESIFLSTFGLESPSKEEDLDHEEGRRYIHIKFEAMILHILAASLEDAQRTLLAALSAGFRESGAVSLSSSGQAEVNPMVAVRSAGLTFDSIIGYQNKQGLNVSMVNERHLRMLVGIANERFRVNTERIERFRSTLLSQFKSPRTSVAEFPSIKPAKAGYEDPDARRQRKKMEGLSRQQAMQIEKATTNYSKELNSKPSLEIDEIFD